MRPKNAIPMPAFRQQSYGEFSRLVIPYGQKIETAQRRQRSNIFGLGPVLHNKLAVDV
jgi:hypothetical protein